jgi:hypothetical protein
MRKLFVILGAAAILGATPAFAADGPTCIRRNDINEWASPGGRALVLQAADRRKVLLQLTSGCSGFGVYDQLAISGPNESGTSCVSAGDTVKTVYAGEAGFCRIVSVTPYIGKMPPRTSHL